MEDDTVDEEELDEACYAGTLRCINSRREGAALLRPFVYSLEDEIVTHRRRTEDVGEEELRDYYIHLLMYAATFVEFFRNNVGHNADYPLRISGESCETLDEFYSQLDDLEDIVGILTEM